MNLRLHLPGGADWASTHLEKSNPNSMGRHTASGIYVSHDNIGFYVDYSSILDRIPRELVRDATHFTLREDTHTARPDGLYHYQTARATVQKGLVLGDGSTSMVTHIDINAKRLCHLIALLRRIHAGSIEPFESWEQPQLGSLTTTMPDSDEPAVQL